MNQSTFVHNFLENSAADFPNKPALFAGDKWYTFIEINQAANRLAQLFLASGIKPNSRIGLLLENSIEYVITYYAILKAGAVTVAINTENTTEEIAYIIEDCEINTFITNRSLYSKAAGLYRGKNLLVQLLVWADEDSLKNNGSKSEIKYLPFAFKDNQPDDLNLLLKDEQNASIVYTSGSTGRARGATLTHLNIVTNTQSIVQYLKLTASDRILVVLPFHYIYGKSLLNTHFCTAGSVVIDNRFLYPNVVLKTMLEQQATGFSGVPSSFGILLNRSNIRKMKFPDLRYMTQAGGAMAPAIQKEVADLIAPAKLYIMYGATEASARLSYLEPEDLPRKWGSIGKAIPDVELFVADQQGHPLAAGVQGELVARGKNIMSGYWNHPDETARVLKNGLYYTGDIGVMDEEGFLYVVGRTRDMIKVGGNRVSAGEIEQVFYEHPSIAEAAVIGIKDDILGEAIKAFVVFKSTPKGANGNEKSKLGSLQKFLQLRLAAYKMPQQIVVRSSLPKNKAGKVQKRKLA